MILIYKFITTLIYPLLIILIYFRKILKKEDNLRYKEKIFSHHFDIKRNNKKKLIWFHAVSIGEFKSILPVIKELNKKYYNIEFLITSSTLSSGNLITEIIKDHKNVHHRFLPVDVGFLVKKFLIRWKPDVIFLVDSEIWPNIIINARNLNIPLALINGRITNKTFKKWKLIPTTAKNIFSSFVLCLSSNFETKDYLIELGAKNVISVGNLKFINQENLSKSLDPNERLLQEVNFWFAVSTHKEEEKFCLETHLLLKKNHHNIKTIIAPRHINRVEEIQNLCKKYNLNSQILNKDQQIIKENEIIIINAFGVLTRYFKYAKSVFMGKSLLKHLKNEAGQNPIEAAKYGCRIFHGPYVYNFQEIYDILEKNNITTKINSPKDLAKGVNDGFKSNQTGDKKIPKIINDLSHRVLSDTMENIEKFLKNENIQA